jgi:acyl-CoA reductase-like NAD-dependent aldehyde dehydrogenase
MPEARGADVLERGLLIGGDSVPASSGKLAEDISPWSGEIYAQVAAGTHGLTGGVISCDLAAALDVASRVRSGILHVNDQGIGGEPMAPFGGVKSSGYGKFGGTAGIESFTEQRWITIQHSGRPAYPF